jgi:hypothetical protein
VSAREAVGRVFRVEGYLGQGRARAAHGRAHGPRLEGRWRAFWADFFRAGCLQGAAAICPPGVYKNQPLLAENVVDVISLPLASIMRDLDPSSCRISVQR